MAKPVSGRISEIFNKFYIDRAKERVKVIYDMAVNFCNGLDIPEGYTAFISEEKIIKLVDSYFLDVIKYKEYHFSPKGDLDCFSEEWCQKIHTEKKINKSKVAAFLAKWTLKGCPIFIARTSSNTLGYLSDDLCHANELFTLSITLVIVAEIENYQSIPDQYIDSMFYDFKYRAYDERLYFSRFEQIAELFSDIDKE